MGCTNAQVAVSRTASELLVGDAAHQGNAFGGAAAPKSGFVSSPTPATI